MATTAFKFKFSQKKIPKTKHKKINLKKCLYFMISFYCFLSCQRIVILSAKKKIIERLNKILVFIIYRWTILLIIAVIITMFPSLYPPGFIKCKEF